MRKVKQFLGVYLLALSLLAAGCTEDVEPSYINSDQDFITYAANSSLFKAQAGRQATQLASTSDIKTFGQELYDYYTSANNELSILGRENGFKVPVGQSEQNQQLYNEMDRLWGKDFEIRYLTEMKKHFEEDIKWFEEATSKVKNDAVQGWVEKHLPTLRYQQNVINKVLNDKENP